MSCIPPNNARAMSVLTSAYSCIFNVSNFKLFINFWGLCIFTNNYNVLNVYKL